MSRCHSAMTAFIGSTASPMQLLHLVPLFRRCRMAKGDCHEQRLSHTFVYTKCRTVQLWCRSRRGVSQCAKRAIARELRQSRPALSRAIRAAAGPAGFKR